MRKINLSLFILVFFAYCYPMLAKGDIRLGQSDYAKSVVAYGIVKQKMGIKKNKSKTLRYGNRCVFYPIFKRGAKLPSDYRGWSIRPDSAKKYPLSHLKNLSNYTILDNRAVVTQIKYTTVELTWNNYPNYFVGAPVPRGGCGALLIVNKKKQKKKGKDINIDKYIAILDKNEKSLVISAVCSKAALKVVYPRGMKLDCKMNKKIISLKDKSNARYFFDGVHHYLVRTYKQPRSLILFRIDTKKNELTAFPGFIGLGTGESYLHMEYFMYFDIDNDGLNELLVKQYGWEWKGFRYLKRESGYWN